MNCSNVICGEWGDVDAGHHEAGALPTPHSPLNCLFSCRDRSETTGPLCLGVFHHIIPIYTSWTGFQVSLTRLAGPRACHS